MASLNGHGHPLVQMRNPEFAHEVLKWRSTAGDKAARLEDVQLCVCCAKSTNGQCPHEDTQRPTGPQCAAYELDESDPAATQARIDQFLVGGS